MVMFFTVFPFLFYYQGSIPICSLGKILKGYTWTGEAVFFNIVYLTSFVIFCDSGNVLHCISNLFHFRSRYRVTIAEVKKIMAQAKAGKAVGCEYLLNELFKTKRFKLITIGEHHFQWIFFSAINSSLVIPRDHTLSMMTLKMA